MEIIRETTATTQRRDTNVQERQTVGLQLYPQSLASRKIFSKCAESRQSGEGVIRKVTPGPRRLGAPPSLKNI